jgi:anti-anti-sigma regulatory factor
MPPASPPRARQCGGDLLLAAPRKQVRRVLALTGLADVFSVRVGPDPMETLSWLAGE